MSTSTAHHCIRLLFLLCLSLHACNAGRLREVQKKSDNKFHIIKKSTKARGSDHSIPVVPMMKSFSSKPSLDQVENGESTVLQTQSDSINSKKPKQTKTNDDLKTKSGKNTKGSASASASGASVDHPITSKHDKSSFVSVSWRVPRNKRGIQKQPGFNLDYSPPKTHPPSHN